MVACLWPHLRPWAMAPSLGSGLQVSGLGGSSSRAMASKGLAGFGDTPSSHHCPPALGLRSGFRLLSLGKCQTRRGSRNLDNYGRYYYFLSLNRGQITHLNTTTSAGHRREGPPVGGGALGEHMEERGQFETSPAPCTGDCLAGLSDIMKSLCWETQGS